MADIYFFSARDWILQSLSTNYLHRSRSRFDFFFGEKNYEFITGGFEHYDFEKIYATRARTARLPVKRKSIKR